MGCDDPVIFAMNGSTPAAQGIESWIADNWIADFRLAEKFEWRRHDRESYALSKVNVRGRKVYVVTSFASDDDEVVDEKVMGTYLFLSSLKTASASEITLVGTMLPYMRQDQKDRPRAPIDTAYISRLFWAAGVSRIITIDVHNQAAMQNACAALGVNFDHLEARCLLAEAVAEDLLSDFFGRVVVLTPDLGATKRTKHFQDTLQAILRQRTGTEVTVGFAHANKVRNGDQDTNITQIIEDHASPIEGALVVVPDDILATGSTLEGIQRAVQERGGTMFAACVTHGLFTGDSARHLKSIPYIYTTNSVREVPNHLHPSSRVRVVDISSIFARAIRETHENGSINNLLCSLETESASVTSS